MEQLAQLPGDLVFFTQITMEAAEDPEFLDAMRKAHILGALVGVEAVTPEGLKAVYKDFNASGEELVEAAARRSGNTVCTCSDRLFSDSRRTAGDLRRNLRTGRASGHTFAQFVMLTPSAARWISSAGRKHRATHPRLWMACPSRATG